MNAETEIAYYSRRAEEEYARAASASDSFVAAIHGELAERYAAFVARKADETSADG